MVARGAISLVNRKPLPGGRGSVELITRQKSCEKYARRVSDIPQPIDIRNRAATARERNNIQISDVSKTAIASPCPSIT